MAKKRPRTQNKIQTKISDRKARRKEERKSKKKKTSVRINDESNFNDWAKFREQEIEKERDLEEVQVQTKPTENKKSKGGKKKKAAVIDDSINTNKNASADIYDVVDEETAAAMRKDDEEIAMLEEKLGLHKGSSDKKKLNKEYAKLEGYGDDFGDFLDGLDDMLVNIAGDEKYDEDLIDAEYDSDESDPAVARAKYLLRQEQLKITNSKKSKLEDDDESSDSEGEELVPMKGSSSDNSSEEEGEGDDLSVASSDSDSDNGDNNSENDSDSNDQVETKRIERDHDENNTYRPVGGQDLYGNTIDSDSTKPDKPTKYVPPHLRNSQENSKQPAKEADDLERQQDLRMIQKLLNNNLNRLSENTLESVAKAITGIYNSSKYSTRDVNEKIWNNMRAACVPPHMIMVSLIPIYIACVSGVHYQAGDSVQLGGFVTEKVILEMWEEIRKKNDSNNKLTDSSSRQDPDDSDPLHSTKEASNLMLIICYLYNYNTIHCSLMYDIVRRLIKSFTEIDVELLLLILSHCGSQLRSDDPSALKDIVGLVQERSMEVIKMCNQSETKEQNLVTSSRAQFMISAITDLKNNKRRSTDIAIADKTAQYRKAIGRMKASSASRGDSLRLSVQDILDIETKGRWWVVGGTWVGNQHHDSNSTQRTANPSTPSSSHSDEQEKLIPSNSKQQKLLKLAAKQRMNTDLRRSIFCIIMGSDDCQDAFEKLVRGGLLKGKSEREVVRVLVHCCSQEKVYNPYYAHLSNLICDYQNKCKFTFQLCLWDAFKQFEGMKARKAANLAKLLAHLLIQLKLNLNILKTLDISPDDMPESTIIFLTILFSNIFEACDDPSQVVGIFQRGEPTKAQLMKEANEAMENDDVFSGSARQALKDSLSIFMLHYLEKSPKNVKKSSFRMNLKAAIKACEEDNLDNMI